MRGINRLLLLTIGALCMHQLYGKISIPIARQSCKYSIDISDGWDTIPQNVFLQKLGKFPLDIGLYPVCQKDYFDGNYIFISFLPTMKTLNGFKFDAIVEEVLAMNRKNMPANDSLKILNSKSEIVNGKYCIQTEFSALKDSISIACFQSLYLTKFGYISVTGYKKPNGTYQIKDVSTSVLNGINVESDYQYQEPQGGARFSVKQILMAIGIGFVVYLMLAYVPGLLKKK